MVSKPSTTSASFPALSGTFHDWMMPPYVMARTSTPLALVSVKISTADPSFSFPNGARVTAPPLAVCVTSRALIIAMNVNTAASRTTG